MQLPTHLPTVVVAAAAAAAAAAWSVGRSVASHVANPFPSLSMFYGDLNAVLFDEVNERQVIAFEECASLRQDPRLTFSFDLSGSLRRANSRLLRRAALVGSLTCHGNHRQYRSLSLSLFPCASVRRNKFNNLHARVVTCE